MVPVRRPRVLLPTVPQPDKWAVIACDQFTGQPDYWEALAEFVGDAPSTLKLILPEAFLEDRLASAPAEIRARQEKYLADGIFRQVDGYILVERTLPSHDGEPGAVRLGLIADIALDAYDYTDHNTAPIKATERTVPDRLPPRRAIREAAPLEAPHVMVVCDDAGRSVIEGVYARRDTFEKVYDFDLNMGGGHLRGWLVPDDLTDDLLALERDGLLFVIGDGNHSLAAAKLSGDSHALVELVNIHDDSLQFEPIHRVVFGSDAALAEVAQALQAGLAGSASCTVYRGGHTVSLAVPDNPADAIADIQQILDDYCAAHPDVTIDYIHGDAHTRSVADKSGGLAIFMPTLHKDGLFTYAARRGVLPRKAFSMGHAEDKRYYYELARRSQR
ncbi:MAG: DUF1015 domain-containing protein [Cellulomonadaceae bacterium]|jgi:hypothetical protein|nr:DUF1015 domain-containing protein [Cellulomonadaceae bacterium]